MKGFAVLVYGLVAYAIFFAVFLYLVAFSADLGLAHSVSIGPAGDTVSALQIDLGLIALFGVQHSVMARPGFKAWLHGLLPSSAERSTYVMATNLVLILMFAFWCPIPSELWRVDSPLMHDTILGLSAIGWLLVLVSTFLTNHFDLFGLRQVWLNWARKPYTPISFKEILLYRSIRHPMMLGLLIAFWFAPVMSLSRLLFNLGMTAYIFIGIHFEERGLQAELGQPYREYMGRTSKLLPFF